MPILRKDLSDVRQAVELRGKSYKYDYSIVQNESDSVGICMEDGTLVIRFAKQTGAGLLRTMMTHKDAILEDASDEDHPDVIIHDVYIPKI